MSAPGFTGLPWHATRKATFVSDIHDNVVAAIAECADRASVARLLAAAPDMFAALRFLLCVDFDNPTEHDDLLLESTLEDARAAVAKALGEQPS